MTAARDPDDRVVVIGSGPSGAVAAQRLVQRGIDVLLLDAGRRAPRGLVARAASNTVARWRDQSALSDDRLAPGEPVAWYSSLSLGGLSNYWTAAVPRFAPDDFNEGGRLDERYVWPVGYDDLEPYYQVAERELCVTAGDPIAGVPPGLSRHRHGLPADWRSVVDRATAHGDGVGVIPLAKGDPWMVAARGSEFSSYHCVVRPLERSGALELRRGAFVTQLVWSPSRGRVTGVEFADRASGSIDSVPCRAVVVAAGTVDSTMILLNSVSTDFPDGIGNTNRLVGRYLHDHPREWWSATTERPMRALSHPIYVARRPHATSEPLMATSHTVGLVSGRERLRTYVRATTSQLGVQVFGTMVPQPDLGIEVDRSESIERRAPRIRLAYDRQAVANIESSRERLHEVFGRAGLRLEVPGPFHDLVPGSSVHYAGTARMHHDPQLGVLDAWNRVHDAPSVIVCDMSAFTTGPEKNPTLTAMALAIRAADRLATDLAG